MNFLHHHRHDPLKKFPSRLVYFAEVPKFMEAEIAEVAGKKELEEPEKLDTRSLVERANGVIGSHEQQLEVLPDTFNRLMHDEMVNYFLASPGRFEKDAEAGLDAAEFEAYKEAMVGKVESTMAEYAPTQEDIDNIAESKQQAEKAGEAAENIEPLNTDEVETGLLPIETVGDLSREFQDYQGWNMSLQKESFDLLNQVGELQPIVAKFHQLRSGWRLYKKFWYALKPGEDKEADLVYQKLVAAETKLEEVRKKYEAAQEKLKVYGEVLAAKSDGLKQELVATYGVALEELEATEGADHDQVGALKESFEKLTSGFDELDENIDAAVLKNSVENEKLVEQVVAQKDFLATIRESLRNPEGVLETVQTGWQAGTDMVGGAFSSAGEFVVEQANWLSDELERNKQMLLNIPVLGGATYGLAKVNVEAVGAAAGVAGGVAEIGNGLCQMIGHPVQMLEGLGTLVGLNSQVGAGQAWKEMGKALISYEDFSKGRIGVGVGKLVTNIVTTLTGAAALKGGGKAVQVSYLSAREAQKSVIKSAGIASVAGVRGGIAAAHEALKTDLLKNVAMVREAPAKLRGALQASIRTIDSGIQKTKGAAQKRLLELRYTLSSQVDDIAENMGLQRSLVAEGPAVSKKSLRTDAELTSALEEAPPSSGLDKTVTDAPLSDRVSSQRPSRLDQTMPDGRDAPRELIPEERERAIQTLREANPEAFSRHGDKVAKAIAEGFTDGDIPIEVMDLLAMDQRKLFSADAVEKLVTRRVKAERMKILRENLGDPEFNVDYVDRILSGPPERTLVNGESILYYPNASVGRGGVGQFFKVGILDESTGKLHFAGAKQSIHFDRNLGTEVRGSKLVSEILAQDPKAQKYLIEPIGIADDNGVIFYEVIEKDGVAKNLDELMEGAGISPEYAWNNLLDGARGLEKLHGQKVLHGDFKASQIFIGEQGGQLGDLGTVISFDKYLDNGGMLPGQTAQAAGAPLTVMGGNVVWIGKMPNYDSKYHQVPLTPSHYSGDVYNVVTRHGPEYVWKVDAYSLGVEIESRITGRLKIQKGALNKVGESIKLDGEFIEDSTTAWSLTRSKNRQLLKIAQKLKDPDNLTYTVADAVRDMEKALQRRRFF